MGSVGAGFKPAPTGHFMFSGAPMGHEGLVRPGIMPRGLKVDQGKIRSNWAKNFRNQARSTGRCLYGYGDISLHHGNQ